MDLEEQYKEIRKKCNVPKEDWPEWRKHLYDHGWAIVKNVIPKEKCEEYSSRFWDWVEGFNSGVKRNKPSTWTSDNWPGHIHGIFQGYAIGQTQFVWDVRSEEEIIKIFEMIYQDKELLVSFDGANLSRPTIESRASMWAHFDQGSQKNDFRCIQGFLNLQPCQEFDGGLIVYEDSHLQHDAFFKESGAVSDGDWYKFQEDPQPLKWFKNCKKIKVCCDPGDFVLWDSRTIHYACPPIKHKGTGNCREVVYVSCQPASLANERVIGQKQKAFYSKRMTSHWASENIKLFARTPRSYGDTEREQRFQFDETTLPVLNERARKLAGLDPYY
ncbi:hypothetical protein DICPUDRAFT_94354 [Dictyostelium purpureum]|uniref:Phytanoyl-CoA dioxygenase n=1 Tax=Dictyostelium purpureum TaxID=5786 RepID=F0ZIH5_DICPU|nr:uncharacterized protein DICPUDRAFT_94354 [Dictyostelium purpureum]EGC36280.1 hypothetical protein DICPUDRAFT_94354 [Dictyostelium purpureum]|eukprot:XP_003287226.1 hypothetical protein DICPUDRAFT_94354 [Dictyostelium purpureum]